MPLAYSSFSTKGDTTIRKYLTDSTALHRTIRIVAHGDGSHGEGKPIEMGLIQALAFEYGGELYIR